MIESSVIELLDIGDSAQSMDAYAKKKLIKITCYFRLLYKNKQSSDILYVFFIVLFFIQLWTISLVYVPCKGDLILEVFDYLKSVTIIFDNITNRTNYLIIFSFSFGIILFNSLLMLFTFLVNNIENIPFTFSIVEIIGTFIYHYCIGPIIIICLKSLLCKDGNHIYLESECFTSTFHLVIMILSFIMLIFYLFLSFLYSIFSNVIDLISTDSRDRAFHISCNYEVYCLSTKVVIFIFYFFIKNFGNKKIFIILYEILIIINFLIMSIYSYRNIYYYNKIFNIVHHFGWYISTIFSICILLKTLLNIKNITYYIIIGWILVIFAFYKANVIEEYLLITEKNIFEFKNIKYIEMYKNILLNNLKNRNNTNSKIIIFGIIKKFEEFAKNNPEINYQYRKLLKDENLLKKYRKNDELPLITIIYILYLFYSEKFVIKDEIIIHMCYFLINKFNNPAYSMFLCSKLKTTNFKMIYYKYLLTQDIKEYLLNKLKNNSNKESIKHLQIGSVILYYLYADIFKIKIYDAISNQIDYFDLLKNNVTTNKSMENFLKFGENILKFRKEIIILWEKMIELNPFSDEYHRDYLLYLDNIIQDEFLSKEQTKKYILKKNSKSHERLNIYHNMFLIDTSTVLLTDGYLMNGKIIYSSRNFPLLFMYTAKELLSLNIDDLLPVVVQSFHKELIDNSIKYTNISYVFKHPRDSLLRNKNGGLFNVKLFVKPVPNLCYGLIYYSYLQKVHDLNLIFTLDKELKITDFTEMTRTGSPFTITNIYNLSNNIIGYHIGLIIPDILSLLEFSNGEYIIVRKDYELKGLLYPIEKTREIKNKLLIVLNKIKQSNFKFSDYQGQIEEDPHNIISEYNDFVSELNLQNNKPFNIFYNIKVYKFIEGKYKYYRIYVKNNIITEKDYGETNQANKDINDNHSEKNKLSFFDFKSNISRRSKESKKMIKLFNNEKKLGTTLKPVFNNNIEGSQQTKNSKNVNVNVNVIEKKNSENKNQLDSCENNDNNDDEDNEKKNVVNQMNSLSLYNSQINIVMTGFNRMKKDIKNEKLLKIIKNL